MAIILRRRTRQLRREVLSRRDHSGANLSRAKLYDLDLHGKVFRDADLSRADLTACNLIGADLEGANLTAAYAIATEFDDATMDVEGGRDACFPYRDSGVSH